MNSDNLDDEAQALVAKVAQQTGVDSATVAKVFSSLLSDFSPPDTDDDTPAAERLRTIPEVRMRISVDDPSSAGVDPRKASENRTKIGGDPDWIQTPRHPVCCNTKTTFYAQFDSNLGTNFSIADAGILYVFLCELCVTPYCELQNY